MDSTKILSADLLDIIFDDRNKEYGAYHLRKTYPQRIIRSLFVTGISVLIIFTGVVLANKNKPEKEAEERYISVDLTQIPPEEEEPEPIPEEPPRRQEEIQVQTERLTNLVVAPNEEVIEPPPTQDELATAKIDVFKQDGTAFDNIATPPVELIDQGKGIIDKGGPKEPEIFTAVEVEAKFIGNWEKFLLRNLNGNVPVDNNAPPGVYTVVIQFVVDVDGNVSDIKPLTSRGYGMEAEAIRVLRKATKWEPAFQNSRHVKAYRKQPITFQVTGD